MDQNLNRRAKTIKSQKKIGISLHGLRYNNGFLDKTSKAQATKEKNR